MKKQSGFAPMELMISFAALIFIAAIFVLMIVSGSVSPLSLVQNIEWLQRERALRGDPYGSLAQIALKSDLPDEFRKLAFGRATSHGYHFRVFLPDKDGMGVCEIASGKENPAVDIGLAKKAWCCYAWPINQPMRGDGRVYFVASQDEVVRVFSTDAFWGFGAPPSDFAFRSEPERSSPTIPITGIAGGNVGWMKVESPPLESPGK
jgi:hypothetical protein